VKMSLIFRPYDAGIEHFLHSLSRQRRPKHD
jgi:hypothetical protein